jgi:hypothetical protein
VQRNGGRDERQNRRQRKHKRINIKNTKGRDLGSGTERKERI